MRTHYQPWPAEDVTACGRTGQPSTLDPAEVDCRHCRASYRWLEAVGDQPPPLPPKAKRRSVRQAVRAMLDREPATAKRLAEGAGVTARRVRQVLAEDGATMTVDAIDHRVMLWHRPDGGWPC